MTTITDIDIEKLADMIAERVAQCLGGGGKKAAPKRARQDSKAKELRTQLLNMEVGGLVSYPYNHHPAHRVSSIICNLKKTGKGTFRTMNDENNKKITVLRVA